MAQYAPISASSEWHPSLSNQHRSNILTHTKRKAEDDLDSQTHISSQFKKLRLNQTQHQNNNINSYNANATASQKSTPQHHYPVPAAPSTSTQHAQPTSPPLLFRPLIANTDARPALVISQLTPHPDPSVDHHASAHPSPDLMALDLQSQSQSQSQPHPNRIIITDLSSEIAQIEADEASSQPPHHLIFPEDIDKKVSALPHHLFTRGQNHDRHPQSLSQLGGGIPRPPENLNTALILYKEPSSISVPEEEDMVRKTIIEARRRAREKTAEEQREKEHLEREAETRARQHHQDEQIFHPWFPDEQNIDTEEEMDEEGLDPMDID